MNTTITPSPLALFSGAVSTRTWNLLTRNGLADLARLRQALANGLKPGDVKRLGQVALLEIRLALDNLPADAPEPAPVSSLSPLAEDVNPLSGRELTLILALAEAGLNHLDPRISMSEALATLGHLRQLAGEDETGNLYPDGPDNDPWPPEPQRQLTADYADGRTVLSDAATGIPLPRYKSRGEDGREGTSMPVRRPEPEPVDDSFEGYVIDPKPG